MTHDTRHDQLSGLLRVASAAVVWGTIPLALRAAEGASIVKVFYRVVFAAVALALYSSVTGRMRELRVPWRTLRMLLGQGAILTLNWALFFGALDRTTVATAELLGYTGPVFVAALAPFVTREPFQPRILGPIALALTGIVVILAPQGLSVGSPSELLGAGMAFASSLTYATLLLRSKKIMREVSSVTLMIAEYGVATLALLPFALLLPGPSSPGGFAAVAYLGLVTTAITGLVFLSGIRRVRTDHAAVLTYAEPVSAVLFAAAFLGERLTLPTVAGASMVVAGGVLVARIEPGGGLEEPEALGGGGDLREGGDAATGGAPRANG